MPTTTMGGRSHAARVAPAWALRLRGFNEWMMFDNYMISNLQFYLNNGLVRSEFKNLGIRKLASQTSHEFIEWLGLVEGTKPTDMLVFDKKIFKDDLYNDFITDNPDFAPKAKMTISRTNFYKWLIAFASYKDGIEAVEGRDSLGRWIIFKTDETKVPVDDGFVF